MSNIVTVISNGPEAQIVTVVGVRGPQGPSSPGRPGLGITGAVATAGDLPGTASLGDLWVTRDDGHGHSWTTTGWVDVGPIAIPGPAGKAGNIHFKGHGAPGTILGAQPGDSYLDELTGTIYTLL